MFYNGALSCPRLNQNETQYFTKVVFDFSLLPSDPISIVLQTLFQAASNFVYLTFTAYRDSYPPMTCVSYVGFRDP